MCERFAQGMSGVIDTAVVNKMISFPEKAASYAPEGFEEYIQQNGLRSLISIIEKKAVEESMKRNNGKITACIKELKISSSAFYRILQEHRLSF
jgi:DNA-binding NtrC family response regulator